MGATIKAQLKLDLLDKSKIFQGKKHNYYDIIIYVNDETRFGNNVSIVDNMSIEDSKNGVKPTYLGNGQVFKTDGNVVMAEKEDAPAQPKAAAPEDDLPF